MPTSHVFCGLCGQKDIALFDHVRNAHQIDIAEYEKQCPNAPLFGESLGQWVVEGKEIWAICRRVRSSPSCSRRHLR